MQDIETAQTHIEAGNKKLEHAKSTELTYFFLHQKRKFVKV